MIIICLYLDILINPNKNVLISNLNINAEQPNPKIGISWIKWSYDCKFVVTKNGN